MENQERFTIRRAKVDDLAEVAKVHVAGFKGYFMTKLGEDIIEDYYKAYLEEDDLFVVACDNEKDGKIVGFYMGYYAGTKALSIFENRNRWKLIRRLAWLCLKFDKDAITRCWARVCGVFNKKKPSPIRFKSDIGMLSSTVLDEYRGKGIMTELINASVKIVKEKYPNEPKTYHGTTHLFNKKMRSYYIKNGYTEDCIIGESVRYVKTF